MKKLGEATYNERLFEGGFRRRFHLARFEWVRRSLANVAARCDSVIELGCFDGRSIGYLPTRPQHYLGLDADWEGGLELAKAQFSQDPRCQFVKCETPHELRSIAAGRSFDTAICLETLEHVPPDILTDYVRAISEFTTGHLAVTVPNEKGFIFLGKYLVKKAFRTARHYEFREVVAATMGNMDAVTRDEHKGFDYEVVVDAVGRFFDIVEVSGYPVRSIPRVAGFGVGILAKAKPSTVV